MSPNSRIKIKMASKKKGKKTSTSGKRVYVPALALKAPHKYSCRKYHHKNQVGHKLRHELGPKGGGDGGTPPLDAQSSESSTE